MIHIDEISQATIKTNNKSITRVTKLIAITRFISVKKSYFLLPNELYKIKINFKREDTNQTDLVMVNIIHGVTINKVEKIEYHSVYEFLNDFTFNF